MSDAWGRKAQMIIGTFICGIGAALIGFVPDGAWLLFALLRFVVGVGLTAAVVPALTIVVELTPTRHRTMVTSFYVVFATAGGFLASATSAALLAAIGWRGMAMLGISVTVVGVLAAVFVPESVRWLTAKGRFAEARAKVAKHLGVPLQSVPLPTAMPLSVPRGRLSELLSQPRQFWETLLIWGGAATAAYGVYLWGPTVVALLLKVPVPQAAKYFIYVTGAGIVGKIVVSFLAPLIGRRLLGVLWGFGGVVALATVGYCGSALIGNVPLIVVALAASAFCIDGSFSNLAPYTVESYGVRLGARASGLGPDRERRRQDPRAAEPGADRRAPATSSRPRRPRARCSGVPVSGLRHGAGRVVVRDPRAGDARPGDGAWREAAAGSAPAVGARRRDALTSGDNGVSRG